jgi:hypothetical protein
MRRKDVTCFFCEKENEVTFPVNSKKDAELRLCKFHARMLFKGLAQYSSGKYQGENQIVFF